MRRKKRHIFNRFFPLILTLILFLGIGFYFLFLNPITINCGIVIDKKQTSNFTRIKLGYNDKTKWIMIGRKLKMDDSLAYNVKLKGIIVQSISPCKVISGKVMARSSKWINIDNKVYTINSGAYYSKIKNRSLTSVSPNKVIVGYSTYEFLLNSKNEVGGIIIEAPEINSIRVGISNYNFSSLDHTSIVFYSKRKLNLNFDGKDIAIPSGNCLKADYKNDNILLSIYNKRGEKLTFNSTIGLAKTRVYVSSPSMSNISILSLKRFSGYIPSYPGSFELYIDNKSIHLINEVNMEDYLKYVVPSEMLPSGGIESYKVQSVSARTYVLSDMLSGRFAKKGFHVDDSTLSQVYNSVPTNSSCEQAVDETSGEIITYKDKIIDAKYYSTSCGVGAPFNEIWYSSDKFLKQNAEPYLDFKNYSQNNIKDLSDEDTASNFLKDWTIKAYDSNSPYFRWKYTLDKKLLNATINSNIYKQYIKNPSNFKLKWKFGLYKKAVIPPSGIGKIQDIYISKRGKAGNIMSMTIETDTGVYKIDRDSNIKSILTPKNTSFEITPIYGTPIKNPQTLPSSFFVIDKQLQNSRIQSLTIYGGGFGHGVGMSQYGVIGLVRQGKNYKEILRTFYKDTEIKSSTNILKNYLN